MKQIIKIEKYKKHLQRLLFLGLICLLLLISGKSFAQADSTKNETPEAAEESSLISPSLEFVSVQKGDNTIDLNAGLKAKINGAFKKLPLLKITFLQIVGDEEKQLGFAITDDKGKVSINIKTDSLKADVEGKLNFKAIFAGNKQMDPAEEELTIKRALLEMIPVKEDSALSVQIKLTDIVTGKAVPETVVGIFVNRLFFPQKLGEGTTDENGEAIIEIANNLPGDEKGNLMLMAKLDENEIYGNLETNVVQKWGVPVSATIEKQPRALWSSHPPVWMLITFFVLMAVVWGHYIVIVVQLFLLRKEEPHTTVIKSNS